jgi:hypothetical protein
MMQTSQIRNRMQIVAFLHFFTACAIGAQNARSFGDFALHGSFYN